MEPLPTDYVELLRSGASKLTGHKRRIFVAEVALTLCDGSARVAESRFGWGRVCNVRQPCPSMTLPSSRLSPESR